MAAAAAVLAAAVRELSQGDPYELLSGIERVSYTHQPRMNRRAFVAALQASPPPQVREPFPPTLLF
jgi:hypothetical protein